MHPVFAIVGCGGIAQHHFPGLEKAGASVTWTCDVNLTTAETAARRFQARATADWRQVVEDPAVEAVLVCSVTGTHPAICLAAIAAGKAVICEKTLATNPDDALAVVSAAEVRGSIFYTAYMKRYLGAVEKAQELLPAIGTIVSTHIRAHQPWGGVWDGRAETGANLDRIVDKHGGGILVCGGSHILDLVCHFLGRPTRVFAVTRHAAGSRFDLLAAALVDTAHGPCHYEALAHGLDRVGYLRDGWDERIEIIGTEGRLEVFSPLWDKSDAKGSLLVHHDGRTGCSTEHRFHPVSPFVREEAVFCASIREGRQGPQSRLTGYDVDELIAAIGRSAASGQAVNLAWRI